MSGRDAVIRNFRGTQEATPFLRWHHPTSLFLSGAIGGVRTGDESTPFPEPVVTVWYLTAVNNLIVT